MTHEELQELVAVYALDALDDAEVAVVEEHLAGCPRCRSELQGFREAAAALADHGGPARPEIWDGIAGRLGGTPPPPRLPAAPRRRRSGAEPRFLATAAAAAAVAIAFLGWDVAHLSGTIDRLRTASAGGIAQAARTAAHAPGARRLALRSATGAFAADVVVEPNGQAYLVDSSLPTLPLGRTYQLWGLSGNRPVSLGLLGARAAPAAFRVDALVSRLMITAEPAGGVPAPTSPVLAQGSTATVG